MIGSETVRGRLLAGDHSAAARGTILMVAYVFPPFFSIGGSIRIVKFVKYLSKLGWRPIVLTIRDDVETATQRKVGSAELLRDIPSTVPIYRTSSTGEPSAEVMEKESEARRKPWLESPLLRLRGMIRRFAMRSLLLPDSRITWLPFVLKSAREIARVEPIDAIFVTAPPHSVAVIGTLLKDVLRRPLIVDYRDDWVDTPWFEEKSRLRQILERHLERRVVKKADQVIAVTDWSRQSFISRYPWAESTKFNLIPNGCDLQDLSIPANAPERSPADPFTIVHAGQLQPWGAWRRNPVAFFQAISNLNQSAPGFSERLSVVFTGVLPEPYRVMVKEMGLSDVVTEVGHLAHSDYVRLLSRADLLLTINYDGFATLIPGKIYEYWAVGQAPILLLSCRGAASSLFERYGLGRCVDPYDVQGIEQAIRAFVVKHQSGRPVRISRQGIEDFDRKSLARRLSDLLERTIGPESRDASN